MPVSVFISCEVKNFVVGKDIVKVVLITGSGGLLDSVSYLSTGDLLIYLTILVRPVGKVEVIFVIVVLPERVSSPCSSDTIRV